MIFPGFPGDLSFIHVEWEPCDVIYSKQSIHQVVTFFAKKLSKIFQKSLYFYHQNIPPLDQTTEGPLFQH